MNIISKIPRIIIIFLKYLFLYIIITLLMSGLSFLLLDKMLGSLFQQLPGDLGRGAISLIAWLFFLLFMSMGVADDAEKDAKDGSYNIITFANIFVIITLIMLIPVNHYNNTVDIMGHPFSYIYTPFMWLFFFLQRTVFVSNMIVLILNMAVFLFVYHKAYNSVK